MLGVGNGGGIEPYFHLNDVNRVIQASNSIVAVRVVRASFTHDLETHQLVVLVGITQLQNDIDSTDVIERHSIFNGPEALAALPCPPLDGEGPGPLID